MGQTLGEPITTKETDSCSSEFYKVGSSSMQGWRKNMEDAHTHILSVSEDQNAAFFAVYDGHGGARVSQYASLHLHKLVLNNPLYSQGHTEEAIKRGFLELDEQMLNDKDTKDEMCGTTAITVFIKDFTIFCGNVGDSRAIASLSGQAIPLSFDHKPGNEEEMQRIYAAGGYVECNRVNGNLALSRALGDFGFKRNNSKSAEEQIVTANPEIHKYKITLEHEFLVLACDGIWDVMSNQEVVDFCRELLAEGIEPQIVCEKLLERCLAPDCDGYGFGCDNMTAIIVCLLQNQPVKQWQAQLQVPSQFSVQSFQNTIVKNATEPFATHEALQPGVETAGPYSDSYALYVDSEQFSTPSQSPKPLTCLDETNFTVEEVGDQFVGHFEPLDNATFDKVFSPRPKSSTPEDEHTCIKTKVSEEELSLPKTE